MICQRRYYNKSHRLFSPSILGVFGKRIGVNVVQELSEWDELLLGLGAYFCLWGAGEARSVWY